MDLDSEKDENYYGYSYFYIRPSDIVESILPDLYQVTVVYRYGFSLTETGEGFVRLVDDPRHVIVDAPSEIAFGDCKDDFINIYVEGTKGYLRVLLDGEEVINDSVFNLRYENDSDSPKNFISISLDDLSIGTHTYNVSYFDGNWDNVSFSDEIDVTYLFEVSTEADDIFYDDDYVYCIYRQAARQKACSGALRSCIRSDRGSILHIQPWQIHSRRICCDYYIDPHSPHNDQLVQRNTDRKNAECKTPPGRLYRRDKDPSE